MKKFILISCLAFLALGAMAADLRQTAPPENDVGCFFTMPTIYTDYATTFELQEFSWLSGTAIAAQDCATPEQVSTEVAKTTETSVQVRLAEFRWPNLVKSYIIDSTLPDYNRARANLSAGDNIYFQVRSAA